MYQSRILLVTWYIISEVYYEITFTFHPFGITMSDNIVILNTVSLQFHASSQSPLGFSLASFSTF